MSVDATALERYLALLETADDQIDRASAAELRRAAEALAEYAQSIAHRQSGLMADSIHTLGPFAVGQGTLESHIESGAWYTPFELMHGGDHDWATRTLDEQTALLDRLQAATGRIVATIMGGGG